MENLKVWLRLATPEEREQLASAAGTSVNYLYQLAAGTETDYKRYATSETAIKIEKGAAALTEASNGRLPTLLRTDMSRACRDCEFAERCLGSLAVASEFRFLPKE